MTKDSTPVTPIAPGAVLAHVGMPKTGTTAIQMALSAVRDKLVANGVVIPGTGITTHLLHLPLLGGCTAGVEL